MGTLDIAASSIDVDRALARAASSTARPDHRRHRPRIERSDSNG
jgi:hypothetical protein